MRKLLLLLAAGILHQAADAQYWQQKVDYIIDVTLNDRDKTLDAFQKITYTNHSPDTLHFIPFHLWPNAYKNDKTSFSEQLLQNGNTKFYFSEKEQRGYINRLEFKVDGVTARTEDHPQHIDITRLILPKKVFPGETIIITTPFHVKLPYNFSRGGYDGETFQVSQWYPKPAVYDKNGWHEMPYLDQGEFYSEFGSFDVRITVPSNYVVAATGVLQDTSEMEWWKSRSDFEWKPDKKKTTSSGKKISSSVFIPEFPVTEPSMKTIRFLQTKVHDFAWFADKRFMVKADTLLLPSGRTIDVFSFYTTPEKNLWDSSIHMAKDALRFYSQEVGEYPYSTMSLVQGPASFGGGMEYPTITVISPLSSFIQLDQVIAHEVGHNWFYGILASNEREHPWMDEGMNSFYEEKYLEQKYGPQSKIFLLNYETRFQQKRVQKMETRSEEFEKKNYELTVYSRAAVWLKELERSMTPVLFNKAMQQYFKEWQFKHPQPQDFRNTIFPYYPRISNVDTGFYPQVNQPSLNYSKPHSSPFVISPLYARSVRGYLVNPRKNILVITPAIGFNSYDKVMLGAVFTSYKIPPNKLNYLLVPLFSTGAAKLRGLGRIHYSLSSQGFIRKTDFFLNASTFSMDEFKDTAGRKLIMEFRKLVPGFRFTFRQKDPRSTVRNFIHWKTFLISEQSLRITRDTIFTGPDTALILRYALPKENRYLNQLRFVHENYRALYPYDLNFNIDQSEDFIRPTITANYFFNYKEGGLRLRFFAGKFLYLGDKTNRKQFATDRYHLNMTGANGYEDYTYSDYFIGRNRFEEYSSQQIMIRDGAFKVRTDLLADKVGRTDNWLVALNLNTTIPDKLNPLSVLPIRIPLRLFLDIGTYAEAWDRDAESDRFLFDAGIHIPLLDEMLNIYIPILYNKVYGDYFKSTIPKNRFLKTISFSINFYSNSLRKLNRDLEF